MVFADDWIGSNAYRSTPRMNLTDSRWHMITVTTLPSGAEVWAALVLCLLQALQNGCKCCFVVLPILYVWKSPPFAFSLGIAWRIRQLLRVFHSGKAPHFAVRACRMLPVI